MALLAESAALARRCGEEGITFVGPSVANLELFGDKGAARALAKEHGAPVIAGTDKAVSVAEAGAFFGLLQEASGTVGMMIKAVAGGGGRGMRVVTSSEEIGEAGGRSWIPGRGPREALRTDSAGILCRRVSSL